jgi:hypothetical protein
MPAGGLFARLLGELLHQEAGRPPGPPVLRLRAVLATLACEVVVAAFAVVLLGFPVFWAVLLGLPIAAVLLLFLSTGTGIDVSWQPLPGSPTPAAHLEAATLAGRLADAARDQGRYRTRIQPRLARLAVQRLRGRPGTADLTDLRDPRAAAVLGPDLHRLLTDPRATLPTPARLADLLDRLETL